MPTPQNCKGVTYTVVHPCMSSSESERILKSEEHSVGWIEGGA